MRAGKRAAGRAQGRHTNPRVRRLTVKHAQSGPWPAAACQTVKGGAWLRRLRCKTNSVNACPAGGPVVRFTSADSTGVKGLATGCHTHDGSGVQSGALTSFAALSVGNTRSVLQQIPRLSCGVSFPLLVFAGQHL